MRVKKAARPGPCDVVVAVFVFGPQRCMMLARFTTEDDGETFYICAEHIAASRSEVER